MYYNEPTLQTRYSYVPYGMLLHTKVTRFRAKNYSIPISDWQFMFREYFVHLKVLDMALSCSDELLELIPAHCPQLEFLNATCKFERVADPNNALSFRLAITDVGIGHLRFCRRLRVLHLNEPRSCRRNAVGSLTHGGLRRLLRNVPTLEEINYSDSGNVVSTLMSDVPRLRLKMIRHFCATLATMTEILRLCYQLESLHLKFFNHEPERLDVIDCLIEQCPPLATLELTNMTICTRMDAFFGKLGASLSHLTLINSQRVYSFADLQTVGRCCGQLQTLGLSPLCTSGELLQKPANIGQFSRLERLYLTGRNMHTEMVLTWITENAADFQCLELTDSHGERLMDDMFVDRIDLHGVRKIGVLSPLVYTLDGIRRLVRRYDTLESLHVFCREDCTDFVMEMQTNNYQFGFINH